MTGAQVLEARRLLGWSSYRLAGICSVSAAVIRAYETKGAVVAASPTIEAGASPVDRVAAMRTALEAAGIEFTDDGVAGVRLRAAPARDAVAGGNRPERAPASRVPT